MSISYVDQYSHPTSWNISSQQSTFFHGDFSLVAGQRYAFILNPIQYSNYISNVSVNSNEEKVGDPIAFKAAVLSHSNLNQTLLGSTKSFNRSVSGVDDLDLFLVLESTLSTGEQKVRVSIYTQRVIPPRPIPIPVPQPPRPPRPYPQPPQPQPPQQDPSAPVQPVASSVSLWVLILSIIIGIVVLAILLGVIFL